MSLSRKGKHYSPRTEFKKGNILSKEIREKMGKSRKGHIVTKETREKIRQNSGKYWLGKKGVNSAHYIDGRTPENEKIRRSLELKLWRKACLERDNYTDQKSGILGGELVVHHINNFAEFPELQTSISNGITLSKKSHQEFHKKYGFKNNTREQLEEFLKN